MQLRLIASLRRSSNPTQPQYIPLPVRSTGDEEGGEWSLSAEDYEHMQNDHWRHSGARGQSVFWMLLAALLSSITSVVVSVANARPKATTLHSNRDLQRLTTYPNIDKIASLSFQHFPSIINFPQTVLQVYKAEDGGRTVVEDDHIYPSQYGSVYSDDRRILISSSVSTIAQFRVSDHGMNLCVLSMSLTNANDQFNLSMPTEPIPIDIWLLNEGRELTPSQGWWNVTGNRKRQLTTLSLSFKDADISSEFYCGSGEYITVELICNQLSSNCSVDFWQNQLKQPRRGLYMTQFQSIHDVNM